MQFVLLNVYFKITLFNKYFIKKIKKKTFKYK